MPERTISFAQPDAVLLLADGERLPVIGDLVSSTEVERARSDRAAKPDESWTYTDPAGHVHKYVRDADDVPRLPSLERRSRQVECDGSCGEGDCGGYPVTEWFCRECNALVEPGMVPDYYVRDVGLAIYQTTDYQLTVKVPPPTTTDGVIRIDPGSPSLIGPFEGSAYAWVDAEHRDSRISLPPMHAGDVEFESSKDGVTLLVKLHGSKAENCPRKPTGP